MGAIVRRAGMSADNMQSGPRNACSALRGPDFCLARNLQLF
ncbi:hypothetical protein DWUX_2022 [Desulfovibrio diazotrophicus]|nr:hypothetical protein DWUX_2022 [Desulfovibrio diazotrophicus]